jgi:catechol 2,3-dioxygenase-like lactoylglutathione lyase family enzyme
MNFQGVVMNVADLNRSIDFYRQVLDFTVNIHLPRRLRPEMWP